MAPNLVTIGHMDWIGKADIALVLSIVAILVSWRAVVWTKRQARAAERMVGIEEDRDRGAENQRQTRRLAHSMGKFYEERWGKD